MSKILTISKRPLNVFVIFSCNCKTALDIPRSTFMDKNVVIMIWASLLDNWIKN